MNYKPEEKDADTRKSDFLRHHPNPEEIMLRLSAAMGPAGVGRDMRAITPPIAYGQDNGVHKHLGDLRLSPDDFEKMATFEHNPN